MKRIVANLSLTASLLITAAVLSPLFQSSAPFASLSQGLSLLITPQYPEVATLDSAPPEVGSRSSIDTGLLLDAPPSRFAQFCNQGGLGRDLICSVLGSD